MQTTAEPMRTPHEPPAAATAWRTSPTSGCGRTVARRPDKEIAMALPITPPETPPVIGRWARVGLWMLPLYGVLTLWGNRNHQPDYTTDFPAYAEYISRDSFLWEHLLGSIGGTALALLGLTALFGALALGRAGRWALAGFVTSVVGNALILTLFGVAAFASPAIGRAYLDGQPGVAALNDEIYGAPLFATGVLGVLLYGAGAALFAVAIWRAGLFPRWTALLYAATGPLLGLIGLAVGEARTLGAALLIVSTLWMALSTVAPRRQADASEPTAMLASGVR